MIGHCTDFIIIRAFYENYCSRNHQNNKKFRYSYWTGYGYEAFQELAAGGKWHEHQRDVYHAHRKVKERLHFTAPKVKWWSESLYSFIKACIKGKTENFLTLTPARKKIYLKYKLW